MSDSDRSARVLVVADVWCKIDGLCAEVRRRLDETSGEVVVVAPALTGWLHILTNDIDAELEQARARLDDVVARLARHGVVARGEVGDASPEVAVDDALRAFPADTIIVVTETGEHRSRQEEKLVRHLEKYGLPVEHILVEHDLAV